MPSKSEQQLYDKNGHLLKQQHYDSTIDKFVEGGGISQFTPLLNNEDPLGVGTAIEGANSSVLIKRTPTTTAGVFLSVGDTNVAPNNTTGSAGDYLGRVAVEVKAMANGSKAGIFLSQRNDSVFVDTTTVGAAIANTQAQTFTSGPNLTATANLLADRVISFLYIPTGETVARWFTTRIVSHAAPSTNTIAVVLEDTPEAGAAPTRWIIHGPQARRIMEPARAEGVHSIDIRRKSVTGGFVAWVGNGIVSADFFGLFNG